MRIFFFHEVSGCVQTPHVNRVAPLFLKRVIPLKGTNPKNITKLTSFFEIQTSIRRHNFGQKCLRDLVIMWEMGQNANGDGGYIYGRFSYHVGMGIQGYFFLKREIFKVTFAKG